MRYLIIIFTFASLSLVGQVTPAQIKKANLIFLERDYLRNVLEEKQRVIDLQDDIIIQDSLLVIDLTNIHLATVKSLHDTISELKEEVINKNGEIDKQKRRVNTWRIIGAIGSGLGFILGVLF